MTQRSSELHATRGEAEEVERLVGAASESQVITSEFRSRSVPALSAEDGSTPTDVEAAPAPEPRSAEDTARDFATRLQRLERQNLRMRFLVAALIALTGYGLYQQFFPEGVKIQKTMMESKELKLLDSNGNPRLFLRMYSRVPVLQILDSNGKPRMSLGLRFDDTPFIDLSDKTGRTRATLEMTEQDAPALRLFDKNGDTTFKIN